MKRGALAHVQNILREIAGEVAELPDAPLRALAPALVQAEKELARELTQVVGTMGAERYSAQMLRRSLVQVRGALNAVERVRPEMRAALVAAGKKGGQLATRHLARELAEFSEAFTGTATSIPLIPASKLADKLLLDRYRKASSRWTDATIADVRHQLAVGMLKGETVGQMAGRLTGRGARFGATLDAAPAAEQARVISGELFRRYQYTASRVVRTEVINAYNEHALEQLEEVAHYDERIMKRWDASLDGRVCPNCRELHGVVVPVDQEFPGRGGMGPPAHPQCRCSVAAWRGDWGDLDGRKARGILLEGFPKKED